MSVANNSWWLVVKPENTIFPEEEDGYKSKEACREGRVQLILAGYKNTQIVTVIVSEPKEDS